MTTPTPAQPVAADALLAPLRCDCDWPPEVPGIPHQPWCASLGRNTIWTPAEEAAAAAIVAALDGVGPVNYRARYAARVALAAGTASLVRAAQRGPECDEQGQSAGYVVLDPDQVRANGTTVEWWHSLVDAADQAERYTTEGWPPSMPRQHRRRGEYRAYALVPVGDDVHARNAPNDGPCATEPAQDGLAGGIGCTEAQNRAQAVTEPGLTPRHPVAVDAPNPPDDGVIVLDVGPDYLGRIARLNAIRAAERADVRGTGEAIRRLDGAGLRRLGDMARVLAAACEAEVLRRNSEDWTAGDGDCE